MFHVGIRITLGLVYRSVVSDVLFNRANIAEIFVIYEVNVGLSIRHSP